MNLKIKEHESGQISNSCTLNETVQTFGDNRTNQNKKSLKSKKTLDLYLRKIILVPNVIFWFEFLRLMKQVWRMQMNNESTPITGLTVLNIEEHSSIVIREPNAVIVRTGNLCPNQEVCLCDVKEEACTITICWTKWCIVECLVKL